MNLPLVWDACGLINLAASGHMEQVLRSLALPHYVVTYVHLHEVQSLRPLPEEADQNLRPIDLSPILATRLLLEIELTQEEEQTQVIFATMLDDGEAKTAAVAKHRTFCVVTDDRAAIRLLESHEYSIPHLKTTEWLKHWAQMTAADNAAVATAIRRIELCARYRPRRDDPNLDWWNDVSA